MINFNGTIQNSSATLIEKNRGFLFGDAIFETLKVIDNKVLFAEDHYFRLMASLEYFEEQILTLTNSLDYSDSARVRMTIFRDSDGFYLPKTNDVGFVIVANRLSSKKYMLSKDFYEIELYKDFYVSKHLLSTLKTTNKMINITGSIFAKENDYHNCLLLNDDKNVVEALNGNIFMKMGNSIITPPISDGCLNGIMRKQLIALINKMEGLECVEKSISPFDLQKSDELFVTNVILGVQPITKYRKKEFGIDFSIQLNEKLNELI
jgi:branched-chain amino acid aminotransferase